MSATLPYRLNLTVDETILLDGRVNAEAQSVVNRAKEDKSITDQLEGATPAIRAFVADAAREAREQGRLGFQILNLRRGDYSGRSDGYWPYKGSGRTHKKGDPDHSRPRTFRGFDVAIRFVRFEGSASIGDSLEFLEDARPFLVRALKDIPAEIPEALIKQKPTWKRYDKAHCTKCDWTGHEGEMGRSMTIMGNGSYPSTCPNCKVQNMMFSSAIDTGGKLGFVVLPVKEETKP